jgi:outer membrane protein assembly factor BamB
MARPVAGSTDISRSTLESMAEHYRLFSVLEPDKDGNPRYVYADDGPHIYVHAVENGRSVLAWETNVGSSIRSLIVVPIPDSDREVIVVATSAGKIFAYSAQTFSLLRENLMEPFQSISAFALADVDGDAQMEAVIVGAKEGEERTRIYIYDGLNRSLLWQSNEEFSATEILVANLDDDVQPEIILNSGVILDSRFHTIESNSSEEGGFGVRIKLLDINGDGIPEIFGEGAGQGLRVYDPYAQRRLW